MNTCKICEEIYFVKNKNNIDSVKYFLDKILVNTANVKDIVSFAIINKLYNNCKKDKLNRDRFGLIVHKLGYRFKTVISNRKKIKIIREYKINEEWIKKELSQIDICKNCYEIKINKISCISNLIQNEKLDKIK